MVAFGAYLIFRSRVPVTQLDKCWLQHGEEHTYMSCRSSMVESTSDLPDEYCRMLTGAAAAVRWK